MRDYPTFSENLWMPFASAHIDRMQPLCLGIGKSHAAEEEEIVLIFIFKYSLFL